MKGCQSREERHEGISFYRVQIHRELHYLFLVFSKASEIKTLSFSQSWGTFVVKTSARFLHTTGEL